MEFSAGVVLYRKSGSEDLFLLLHYPAGHWDFVKGHLESGESEMDAAVREMYEETGIDNAVFVEGFKRRIRYSYRYEGKILLKQVVFFLARTNTRQVRLSEEHQGYMWRNYRQSLDQVTFKNAQYVLRHAHRFIRAMNERRQ